MMFFLSCILCLCLVVHGYPAEGKTERDLRKDLFRDYDKLVRPVKDPRHAVPTKIAISPLAIGNMDEDYNVLHLHSWILMKWDDEYLQWDPSDYSGIKVLNVPAIEVWRPDISLYTSAHDDGFFPQVYTQTLIYNNGTVLWVPPFSLKSRCPIDSVGKNQVAKSVECVLKFGSWTYSDVMLDLRKFSEGVDLSNFQDTHPLWKLLSVTSERESKHYPCCTESYSNIKYNVTLKRRGSAKSVINNNFLMQEK